MNMNGLTKGMLWYDDDPKRKLAEKVARAAAYYQQKHGHAPTHCHVNRASWEAKDEGEQEIGGIKVSISRTVQLNHFLIGVPDNAAATTAGTGEAEAEGGV